MTPPAAGEDGSPSAAEPDAARPVGAPGPGPRGASTGPVEPLNGVDGDGQEVAPDGEVAAHVEPPCTLPVGTGTKCGEEETSVLGRPTFRLAMLGVLVAAAVAAMLLVDLPSVLDLRTWMSAAGPLFWVGLVVGLAVALLTPAPRSALSVLIGTVAGFPAGLAVVVIGSVLGGLAGYCVSRGLGRAAVDQLAGARLRRVQRGVEQRSVQAVFVARVLPVLPFFAVSYAAGLGGIRLLPYMAGTALGVLPGSVFYVGVGASAEWLVSAASLEWAPLLLVPVVLVLVGGTAAWRKRRRRQEHGTSEAVTARQPPGGHQHPAESMRSTRRSVGSGDRPSPPRRPSAEC